MDEEEWLRRATDNDFAVRGEVAFLDEDRPIAIWKLQVTDKDVDVRIHAAASSADRTFEILTIQATDKYAEVRKVVFARKGGQDSSVEGYQQRRVELLHENESRKGFLPGGRTKDGPRNRDEGGGTRDRGRRKAYSFR